MPATIELDRPARQESYLQHGSSFVDRLRTRLVEREILKRLPRTGGLRVLDLGCGYHAAYLKAIGDRLAEGVGVDFRVSEESRRHPRLRFIGSSVEDALPELPAEAFDAVLCISLLEHLGDPVQSLSHCHRVLKRRPAPGECPDLGTPSRSWNCPRSNSEPAPPWIWTSTRCTT